MAIRTNRVLNATTTQPGETYLDGIFIAESWEKLSELGWGLDRQEIERNWYKAHSERLYETDE